MGGLQIPSCSNCRHYEGLPFTSTCGTCEDLSNWQTKRGRKLGYKPNPWDKKPGPKEFKDQGEKKQIITLSFKANDISKAGGYQKVKEYLTKAFYKIKGL